MTEAPSKRDYARLMKDALLELKQLRASLDALTRAQTEPIAIIGMSCRLPGGVDGPGAFWRLLSDGVDAIGEVPPDRWDSTAYYDTDPDAPGRIVTRSGGFLDTIDEFDPAFFGISPREARSLDPQQRLLLEVSWEALELAGQSPARLYGSPTGVFIGMSTFDYALHQVGGAVGEDDLRRIDGYVATGSTMSPAAGRLSYVLGLNGPSMVIDTACSSSLVATHVAIASLRSRECDLALAGGVNVILRPEWNVNFTKAHMLAPDGRCKTFDASADGYSRGEGCAIVVLQRLSDAIAARRNIVAVIRGSAVNQDGASGGLTVPSGPSQEQVIRRALDAAGVRPGEVGYVEAHGTGTSLGDPIEVAALGAVFGPHHSKDRPLSVGSVKTNIGHLEAAAGIAGLMKAALALRHREIPPHLHFRNGNPMVDWNGLPIAVPVERSAWPAGDTPRRAGISSFGFTGTNVHVVLEEAPAVDAESVPGGSGTDATADRPIQLLALSARSPAALQQLAGRYERHLAAHPDLALGDVAFTAGTGRTHFRHRLALTAGSQAEAREKLAAYAAGHATAGVQAGHGADRPRVAFLFTGQGSRHAGMGEQLYDTEPVFRDALDRCDRILQGRLEGSLFAVEYALAELWKAWGIEPDAVMGHGIGEYVAACVAGVFSLEEGLVLAAERARLMQALPRDGQMAPLQVMEPVLADFERVARGVAFSEPGLAIVSSVTGRLARGEMATAEYWVRHVREPVRFAEGMETLHAQGCRTFVEIGPGATLLAMGRQCLTDSDAAWLPSMRAGDELDRMLQSLAGLYVRGASIDWAGFHRGRARRPVELPTYPFQRQRYWVDIGARSRADGRASTAAPLSADREEMLVTTGTDAVDGRLYTIEWRERDRSPGGRPPAPDGQWIILADTGKLGAMLVGRLREQGARCTLVPAVAGVPDAAELEQALASVPAGESIRGVVLLRSLDAPALHELSLDAVDRHDAAEALVQVVRTVAGAGRAVSAIWCVTRGAVPAGGTTADQAISLAQSPLWGLGRVAALEHPDIWGGLLDLDPAGDVAADAGALAGELLAPDGEDQIAFRGRTRLVPRLVRLARPPGGEVQVDPGGTYLIAGGPGALGLHAARWLVSKGARHLVLASRRGAETPGAEDAVRGLKALGARTVIVESADISSAEHVDALLAKIAAGGAPLRGVVHAAGLDAPVALADMTPADLRSMLASKVRGGWLLHERTRHLDLHLFVCFSSVSSVWGAPLRGHYAAAAAFLDGLAHERRRQGLPALSVNWGPWAGGGLAGEADLRELERSGIRGLDPAIAVRALDALVASGDVQATVADLDWPRFRAAFDARRRRPLLSAIDEAAGGGTAETGVARADWLERLRDLPAGQRADLLEHLVRAEVAGTLGFDSPDEVPVDRSVFELGMDSLRAVELASRLQRHLGLAQPIRFFDCPEVATLARRLLAEAALSAAEGGDRAGSRPPATPLAGAAGGKPARAAAPGSNGQGDPGVVGYAPDREPEIFAFAREAWPRRPDDLVEPRWRWMFVESARRLGLEPRVWLYREDGRIVAHHGAMPVRLQVGTGILDSAWFADTMVLESHRRQAAGARLVLEANDEFPVGLSLGQTEQMRHMARHLGWHQVAPLQTFLLPLRPRRVLGSKLSPLMARMVGSGLAARQSLKRLMASRTHDHLEVRPLDRFDARHDRLWNGVRKEYECAVTRDASYLNWKYVSQPGQEFVRLGFVRDGEVVAVAVLALDEPGLIYRYRRAFIVELVVSPSDSVLVLGVLDVIRRLCAAWDVDAIVCHLIGRKLEAGLQGYGFMRREPTRFLLVSPRRTSAEARRRLLSPDDWLITMGDSDIDRPWETDGGRIQIRAMRAARDLPVSPMPPGASAV